MKNGISASLKNLLSDEIDKDIKINICHSNRFNNGEIKLVNVIENILKNELEINAENIYSTSKDRMIFLKYISCCIQIQKEKYGRI